ncbi:polysaccharide deacetylase family protein [Candidatus Dependentiae bacterium]|nr:polysaccharide deacetylase family protein [Candidatus Dependentiae bacterium]
MEIIFYSSIIIIIFLIYRYGLFLFNYKGIPVLMYHKISEFHRDKLTVTVNQFENQINYLLKKGYTPISFKELNSYKNNTLNIPDKPVILTFDDGYMNNYELAYPVLKKNNIKATIFLVAGSIGKKNEWDEGQEKLIDYNQIKEMSGNNIEFGIHSFNHSNFSKMTIKEIESDLTDCISELKKNNIFFENVIAYPYGSIPEKPEDKNKLKDFLKKHNFNFGLLIKSKINKIPIKNPYFMYRINIKGSDSFLDFKIKLKNGRSKLF